MHGAYLTHQTFFAREVNWARDSNTKTANMHVKTECQQSVYQATINVAEPATVRTLKGLLCEKQTAKELEPPRDVSCVHRS